MSDIGLKQGCHLSPTLFVLYIDELETYLDKFDGVSLCLFNIVVVILLSIESLDGHLREKTSSWSHMLGTHIPSIQGFSASCIHI